MNRIVCGCALLAALFVATPGHAHHGVASLGVAGLEGPGAPVESSSSATLPAGSWLSYAKLDYARFETKTAERDGEGDLNVYWMYGLGYGITPSFSLYGFVPFSTKRAEDNSFTTSGFADPAIMGVLGFKWDEGLKWIPRRESLDEMEDWHFTFYGGFTLPLGNENVRDAEGNIDPGMSLGFGQPSYSLGWTATRQWISRLTTTLDASLIGFREHEYADGAKVRFGDELRLNAAGSLRLFTRASRDFRLDLNFELNYLDLGRDELDGAGEDATGGSMLYVVPGLRAFFRNTSLGVGLKVPTWTDLNEEEDQQGAEGGEDYRLVVSFSALI